MHKTCDQKPFWSGVSFGCLHDKRDILCVAQLTRWSLWNHVIPSNMVTLTKMSPFKNVCRGQILNQVILVLAYLLSLYSDAR